MTTLADLAEINPVGSPPEGDSVSVITLQHVDALTATAAPVIASEGERPGALRVALPGDVLVARISPSLEAGKIAIVPPLATRCALVSREFIVVRPRLEVDARALRALLRAAPVRAHLAAGMVGTAGRRRMQAESLGRLPWRPVASLDAALEALDRLDGVRRMREDAAARMLALPGASVDALVGDVERIPLGHLAPVEGRTLGLPGPRMPVITPTHIRDGVLQRSAEPVRPKDGGRAATIVEPGDLVVLRAQGRRDPIGAVAVYEDAEPAVVSSSLAVLRPRTGADPDYLWAWCRCVDGQAALRQVVAASEARTVRVAAMQGFEVPVPPPAVQDQLGDLARAARRAVRAGWAQQEQLEVLTQAVLARTFSFEDLPRALDDLSVAGLPLARGTIAAASPAQRDAWTRAAGIGVGGTFTARDLLHRRTDVATIEQALGVLERLGVLASSWVDGERQWSRSDLDTGEQR